MTTNVLHELRKLGAQYPAKAPPIPVVMSGLGQVGHVEHRRGVYINSGIERHVRMLMRENAIAERVARDLSDGRFGAGDLLPLAALGTDSRDAIKTIRSMRAATSSWDNVVSARGNSKSWDFMATKASLTTVASNWSSFLSASGSPGAITHTAIPGAAAKSSTDTGAFPLGAVSLGASEDLYLTNFGLNHATGTNIVLLVDVLTANGSISTTIVTSQNVSTTSITRWTGGAGVMMTLEVQSAPGASTGTPTVRVNYTDQDGNAAQDTGTITQGVTSPAVGRLLPLQDGPMIRLASGDYGVRSVQQVTVSLSSTTAGGALSLIQYKPLLLVPTLAVTTFVERSTPAQIGGIRKLTSVSQGSMPFLGVFVLTSTTSTGVQTYLVETVWG
jgi:hypothetical protein